MKTLLQLLILSTIIYAGPQQEKFLELYKNENYKEACLLGSKIIHVYKYDEDLIENFAFSCLESDFIDFTISAVSYLKRSKKSRQNAAYFATIITQKKLLYMSIIDDVDLEGLSFPKTDHIISKVFDKYINKEYQKNDDVIVIDFLNNYKAEIKSIEDDGMSKIIINELLNGEVIKRHIYW